MSPVQERVARIRRRFAMAVLARSVLVAAATAGLIIVAGLTLDALIGLPLVVRGWVAPVAAFVAVAILALGGVPRLREVLASRRGTRRSRSGSSSACRRSGTRWCPA